MGRIRWMAVLAVFAWLGAGGCGKKPPAHPDVAAPPHDAGPPPPPPSPLGKARKALETYDDVEAASKAVGSLLEWVRRTPPPADRAEAHALLVRTVADALALEVAGQPALASALRKQAGTNDLTAVATGGAAAGAEAEPAKAVAALAALRAAAGGKGGLDATQRTTLWELVGKPGPLAAAARLAVAHVLTALARAPFESALPAEPARLGAALSLVLETTPPASDRNALEAALLQGARPHGFELQPREWAQGIDAPLAGLWAWSAHLATAVEPTGPLAQPAAKAVSGLLGALPRGGKVALALPPGAAVWASSGAVGARWKDAPLAVATLDAQGLHLGTRPVLARAEAALAWAAPGWPGAVVLDAAQLDEAATVDAGKRKGRMPSKRAKAKGKAEAPTQPSDQPTAAEKLAAAVAAWKQRVAAVAEQVWGHELAGTFADATWLVVSPDVPAGRLRVVVRALGAAGISSGWLPVSKQGARVLVVGLGGLPAGAPQALLRYAKPPLVVAHRELVHLVPPRGAWKGEGRPPRRAGLPELPRGAKPWYRYEDFVRVDVPVEAVSAALDAVRRWSGGGNVVALMAQSALPVSSWSSLAGILASLGDEPLPTRGPLGALVCDEAACPRSWVVLFGPWGEPASRGLSSKPTARKQAAAPKPAVQAAPPPSAEFCNRADIARVRKANRDAFRYCYEKMLRANADLKGRLVVRFEIPPSGRPRKIRVVSSTLDEPEVGKCVVKRIAKLHFQPPEGGVCVVQWPFTFKY